MVKKYLPPCNNGSFTQNYVSLFLRIFNPVFNHCPKEPQHLFSTFSYCHKKKFKKIASHSQDKYLLWFCWGL